MMVNVNDDDTISLVIQRRGINYYYQLIMNVWGKFALVGDNGAFPPRRSPPAIKAWRRDSELSSGGVTSTNV